MLLAGDVGGTKTILALYRSEGSALEQVREASFASAAYASLEEIIQEFLGSGRLAGGAACIGVAGPVIDGVCQTTNLPWLIAESALAKQLETGSVRLLNDLEAMAFGLLRLPESDWVDLNPAALHGIRGNRAVLAPGTGLGEAIVGWNGEEYFPAATEGGHTDFAPNDAREDALLAFLRGRFPGHVSYERILSGSGLVNLYDFLREQGEYAESAEVAAAVHAAADPAPVISRYGLQERDPMSLEALRLFARILAAEAGNLALKCFARGGVFIGGGIPPKVLPVLQTTEFLERFAAKGRFTDFLKSIPVRVAMEPRTGLLGAAGFALRLH